MIILPLGPLYRALRIEIRHKLVLIRSCNGRGRLSRRRIFDLLEDPKPTGMVRIPALHRNQAVADLAEELWLAVGL